MIDKNDARRLYLKLPKPLSRWAYTAARRTFAVDGRERYFDRAFRRVYDSQTPGDYLEFGVYWGNSLILAARSAEKHGLKSMRLFAFDSFEGLPHSEGRFSQGDYHCDEVTFWRYIDRAGVDLDRVVTVRGLYEDTLRAGLKHELGINRAAVVHVDCDLYSSTTTALSFVEDLVSDGTIVIFDDWYAFEKEWSPERFGEKRAFTEWSKRDYFEEFYDCPPTKAFVCTSAEHA